MGVGGFLGMGEKEVALPFTAFAWSSEPIRVATTAPAAGAVRVGQPAAGGPGAVTGSATTPATVPATGPAAGSPTVYDYPDHGTVSLTRDQLKAAPDFHYASEK